MVCCALGTCFAPAPVSMSCGRRGNDDEVHAGSAVRLACRVASRTWWLGCPDPDCTSRRAGSVGGRCLAPHCGSDVLAAPDAAFGFGLLWNKSSSALPVLLSHAEQHVLRCDVRPVCARVCLCQSTSARG
jgi:hypothetical protein